MIKHLSIKYLGTIFIILIFSSFLSSCTSAKKAMEIQAVRMPVAPYLKMTCGELISEQRLVLRDLESAGVAVDKKYSSEKNTELVAWILFFPAAFMFDGNEAEASQLAALKGQADAIQEALLINKCGAQ